MIRRYFRLEKNVTAIKELDNFIPSPSERRALEDCLKHFSNFSSVSISLQKKGLLFPEAREMFHHICEDYPSMSSNLSSDAGITNKKPFEDAVTKIMKGEECKLTHLERKAASDLILNNSSDQLVASTEPLSYF